LDTKLPAENVSPLQIQVGNENYPACLRLRGQGITKLAESGFKSKDRETVEKERTNKHTKEEREELRKQRITLIIETTIGGGGWRGSLNLLVGEERGEGVTSSKGKASRGGLQFYATRVEPLRGRSL